MTTAARRLTLTGLEGVGEIAAGDDLAQLLLDALTRIGEALIAGDVLAVAQKVVSKAEGRMVRLADVVAGAEALALAAATGKHAALCQLLLGESRGIVRQREGLVIVEDVRGMVLANAGIDASNVSADGGHVLLLPADPDASALRLRAGIEKRSGVKVGVVIVDSIGRAWRKGTVGTAIGVAGCPALRDHRGRADMHGRLLESSEEGWADEIASAASLVMGQADERCPAVLLRGLAAEGVGAARDLLRPAGQDLFR